MPQRQSSSVGVPLSILGQCFFPWCPPPAPCWTCELILGADANHWRDECPLAADRLKNRQCTLYGSPDHWKRACDKYISTKHKPKRPQVTYSPTGPKRANISWCLRCGKKGLHPIVDCDSSIPPILLPTAEDKTEMEGICCWCGIRGHHHKDCMRRAPMQAEENREAICSLSGRKPLFWSF